MNRIFLLRRIGIPLIAVHLLAAPALAESYRGEMNSWQTNWMAQDADLGIGSWLESSPTLTTYTFTDDEGTNTTSTAPASGHRFYRMKVRKP